MTRFSKKGWGTRANFESWKIAGRLKYVSPPLVLCFDRLFFSTMGGGIPQKKITFFRLSAWLIEKFFLFCKHNQINQKKLWKLQH